MDPSSKDQQLLNRIRADDKSAYRQLFDRYYRLLLATAINMLKDVNTAKDVVQDVFLQLWKNRQTIKIQSSLEAYLKRAVINKSLNHIKASKRFTSENPLQVLKAREASAIEQLEADDLQKVIQSAMDQLPEKCRVIFVMRRLEGMRVKEIAQKLEISPKTVENQITKALKVLKEAVKPFVQKNKT